MKVKKVVDIKSNYSFEAPIYPAAIPAGRPKGEAGNASIDLNSYLAPCPGTVYMVRVNGESMIDENIYDGDLLIVDGREEPKDGKVVIAALNGEMAVKTYRNIDDKVYLVSANKNFLPIEIGPLMQFEIQGVVKHVIHQLV